MDITEAGSQRTHYIQKFDILGSDSNIFQSYLVFIQLTSDTDVKETV